MTTFELLTVFDEFLGLVTQSSRFLGIVTGLAGAWAQISQILLRGAPIPAEQLAAVNNEVRSKVNEQLKTLRGITPSVFLRDAQDFQSSIERVLKAFDVPGPEPLFQIPGQVRNVSTAYDFLLTSSFGITQVANLLEKSADLRKSLDITTQMAHLVRRSLVAAPPPSDGFEDLLLHTNAAETLATVGDKLNALAEIYEKLCNALQISHNEFPLTIIRLEIGSSFLIVRGSKAAIQLLRDLLIGVAAYLYRRYTAEGQIASIPRSVEAAESVLKLRDQLAKRGIDTQQIDKFVGESAAVIAIRLNTLLQGQTSISIDGQNYRFSTEREEKLAGPPERHLLDSPDKTDTEDQQ